MYAQHGDEKMQQAFDINRALGGKSLQFFATFCLGRKLRQNVSGGTSADHAEHLHPITHVDPLPPHTHARSPRQMRDPVRILKRRDGLPVMGQLCRLRMSREPVSTIHATEGVTDVFLASIESV